MNKEQVKEDLRLSEGKGPPNRAWELYPDSRGYLSLGYGFLMDPRLGAKIPEPVAEFWLDYKVNEAMAEAIWPWYTSIGDARQNIIICLLYNMGPERLAGFHNMLAALAAGDYNTAAVELQNSEWFKEVGVRGPRYVRILKSNIWELPEG